MLPILTFSGRCPPRALQSAFPPATPARVGAAHEPSPPGRPGKQEAGVGGTEGPVLTAPTAWCGGKHGRPRASPTAVSFNRQSGVSRARRAERGGEESRPTGHARPKSEGQRCPEVTRSRKRTNDNESRGDSTGEGGFVRNSRKMSEMPGASGAEIGKRIGR